MNLQSSTLKGDESGKPFHVQQAEQIQVYRTAWREAGHDARAAGLGQPVDLRAGQRADRAYFGAGPRQRRPGGFIDSRHAPSSAAPTRPSRTCWSSSWPRDDAIAAADTLLLTVPNQLGVDYNAHVLESILKHVAPALGWR